MKKTVKCYVLALCAVVVLGSSAHAASEFENDKEIQRRVAESPSLAAKFKYLSSVISEDQDSSAEMNFRKASAIRILGDISRTNILRDLIGTNSISVLVSNLDFEDSKFRYHPAVDAVVGIGEPAVQAVLRVVNDSENRATIYQAVQVLVRIKGSDYEKFVREQKQHMPTKAWEHLVRFGIRN